MAALLSQVQVIAEPPDAADYDRSCRAGHACHFGPAWSDDTDAPDGHNGCGTRDDVLRKQLSSVQLRPGSRCVVVGGTLADPYTGRTITFTKAHASDLQIDHIYPLARAFKFGARTWTTEQRATFANDTALNLLAVDGRANQSKSAQGPGHWLPVPAFGCTYVTKYLQVAAHYRLAVSRADREAAISACGAPPEKGSTS